MKYVASSISQMTDYDKYYVYTGHEEGMVTGCWYFWSGTEWLIGGDYQCGIDDIIETDTSFTSENLPANAKAVGDMIVVSDTEPTSPHTELWIDPDTESVLVPTMDDIEGTYAKKSEVDSTYARKAAVGSPLRAATASAMTDVTKIYVYTGSESGYTAGHWYYYNGSSWADGGVYNSTAFVTDKTLTGDGEAADAKVTGDEITDLKSAIGSKSSLNTDTKTNLVSAINEINGHFLDGIDTAVDNWLADHPEATTTVQDHSLTYQKLVNGTLGFVTPEMFGAIGDGETDDADALNSALASGKKVILISNYFTSSAMTVMGELDGNGKTIKCNHTVSLSNCANIKNLTLDSDTTTTNAHAITCYNAEKVILENITIENAQQDGIYINNSYVYARNIHIKKAKRNGISFISGNLDIDGFEIDEVEGMAPQIGIDIEPNNESEIVRGIIKNGVITNTKNKSLFVAPSIRAAHLTIEDVEINSMALTPPYTGYIKTSGLVIFNETDINNPCLITLFRDNVTISDPIAFCDIEVILKKSNPSDYYFSILAKESPFNIKFSAWFDVEIAQRTNVGLFRNFGSDATLENTIVYHSNFGKASLSNYSDRADIISGAD